MGVRRTLKQEPCLSSGLWECPTHNEISKLRRVSPLTHARLRCMRANTSGSAAGAPHVSLWLTAGRVASRASYEMRMRLNTASNTGIAKKAVSTGDVIETITS